MLASISEQDKEKLVSKNENSQTSSPFEGTEESADTVQQLIYSYLETLNPTLDVAVVGKSLKVLEDSKIADARNRILEDIQTKLHEVSLLVEEKKKIVAEKEAKLNNMKDEKNIILSNIRQLEHSLSDEIAENERLASELKSIEETLNGDLPLDKSVLTLHLFSSLGIEFMDWDDEKKSYQKFITKSVSENRVSSVALDFEANRSRAYYPDLLWHLVSQ